MILAVFLDVIRKLKIGFEPTTPSLRVRRFSFYKILLFNKTIDFTAFLIMYSYVSYSCFDYYFVETVVK
ncbi:hypothetical protein [Clostridium sp. Marseille-P299]|uniref:hypothetical protein n=1 Tax=Clostridium sp. Marseille-P299 TaxID=1805477 RepID=UPI00082DC6BE|nr:hypothetical protein [Clostridium sp. Marseille-P299]